MQGKISSGLSSGGLSSSVQLYRVTFSELVSYLKYCGKLQTDHHSPPLLSYFQVGSPS
jgi:hypothetical protein